MIFNFWALVDFIKVRLPASIQNALRKSEYLKFVGAFYSETGEVISGKETAEYKGLKFIIYRNGFILMQGSLHKYFNNGVHNYNDFKACHLLSVLQELQDKFSIDLSTATIQNIEFGINIKPPANTNLIIDRLLCHSTENFKDVSIINGNYKQAVHQRYIVKVYNKGLHYNLPYELLRFELKFIKMIDLNKLGLLNLNDLTSIAWQKAILELLTKEWNNVLLYDFTIHVDRLKNNLRDKKLNQWQNVHFWLGLTKQQRFEQRRQYQECVEVYSSRIHESIGNLITKKWSHLLKKDYQLTE